jgi:hypothetical protein
MEYIAPALSERTFVVGHFEGGGEWGGEGLNPSGSFIYSREAYESFVMSFCPSAYISAVPKRLISVRLNWGAFMVICRENPNLVKLGIKYRSLFLEDISIVGSRIILLLKRCCSTFNIFKYIANSDIHLQNMCKMHSCLSFSRVVKQTRHIVKLYVHYIS